jgi:hypothetical protein
MFEVRVTACFCKGTMPLLLNPHFTKIVRRSNELRRWAELTKVPCYSFDADGSYKCVEVVQNASDSEKLSGLRAQFFKHYKTVLANDFQLEVGTLLFKEQNAIY